MAYGSRVLMLTSKLGVRMSSAEAKAYIDARPKLETRDQGA